MIIKDADDRSPDIATLRALSARHDCPPDTRKQVDQEIRFIQSGCKGEADATYELQFHYGTSKNWMVINDLRLECDGRVAQIDHLLINRFLEIYVCESKRFAEGIAINEHGEFAAFYGGKAVGVPSPLEQNNRHLAVLESVFKSGQVKPPSRLGFALMPSLLGFVLVSKNARISRPKKSTLKALDCVLKVDQLKSRIDKDIDGDNNVLLAAKLIGQDTLEEFARRLAKAHKPARFDWAARFGLPAVAPVAAVKAVSMEVSAGTAGDELSAPNKPPAAEPKKSKLICFSCGSPVAYNVAKFCWFNKPRFGGKVHNGQQRLVINDGETMKPNSEVELEDGNLVTISQFLSDQRYSTDTKYRCQAMFRESNSMNGILRKLDKGRVMHHDNGTGVTYWFELPPKFRLPRVT
jgi:hypothetical protein